MPNMVSNINGDLPPYNRVDVWNLFAEVVTANPVVVEESSFVCIFS